MHTANPTSLPPAWEADYRTITICPECKLYPANIIDEFSSGDTVCADCGLVLGERIVDTRSEWRTFSSDEPTSVDPCRVGEAANPLLNGSQLETRISSTPGKRESDLHRAHRANTDRTNNRSLLTAYTEIGTLCDVLQTTVHVATTAKSLFKLVEDSKGLKGKPRPAIIAGCIFIACRQCGVPRTFTEIFALTSVPKKDIGRIFKLLEKFFTTRGVPKSAPTKPTDATPEYETTTATTAQSLMIRFCNQLDLGAKGTVLAERIAKNVDERHILGGKSTLTCTGAIVYMVSHLLGKKHTMKVVARMMGVSEGTVRSAYRKLYSCREAILEGAFVGRYGGDLAFLPVS